MKIVIIDDEKAMHLIMKRMLSKMDGVEISGCFLDTATAYSYLIKHGVDLIFMDINMPRESGLEFAARLRESGKQMKIVFVTSHTEYSLFAFDVYAFDYIVKPVNEGRLQRTIQRALSETSSEPIRAEGANLSHRVMVNCLGTIEIRSVDNVSVRWKTSKSAELFGYLLMAKGRLVSRARIIDDIFSDMPQKNGETYLNTTIYQLRKLLDNYGIKKNLYSDNSYYALDLNDIQVDLICFEEGCKQMTVLDHSHIEQALELERLYNGDLFGDRAFHWATYEVERLSLIYTSFTKRLCAALLVNGDAQTAIRLLTKLTAYNELDEETMKHYMKALAHIKNREALKSRYLQFADTMNRELSLSPSIEVTDLYNHLLSEMIS